MLPAIEVIAEVCFIFRERKRVSYHRNIGRSREIAGLKVFLLVKVKLFRYDSNRRLQLPS